MKSVTAFAATATATATATAAAMLLATGTAHAAERLVNGGFEADAAFAGHTSPVPGDDGYMLSSGSTVMPGWTVINGDVSWAHDGNPYGHVNPLPGDHYVLDLTAYERGPLGGVAQTFSTVAGQTYSVSFDIGVGGSGPSLPSTLTRGPVSVGASLTNASGLPCCDFQSAAGQFDVAVWTTQHFDFVATGTSSTLSIYGSSTGPDKSVFIGLDNVSVTGAVPEPATAVLALLGLGALGARSIALRRANVR